MPTETADLAVLGFSLVGLKFLSMIGCYAITCNYNENIFTETQLY